MEVAEKKFVYANCNHRWYFKVMGFCGSDPMAGVHFCFLCIWKGRKLQVSLKMLHLPKKIWHQSPAVFKESRFGEVLFVYLVGLLFKINSGMN